MSMISDIINQIAEAIEAEIHEAWTESDADFIRGMEYAVSIVKAVDIRTDGDLISREDAVALVIKAIHGTDNKEIQEYLFDGLRKQMWSLPSAESTGAMDEAIQKYIKDGYMQPIGEDLISRQAAIYELEHIMGDHPLQGYEDERLLINALESLPSAEPQTIFIEGVGHFPKVSATSQSLTKPNKSCENDLISRQDALKPFCIAPDGTRIPEVDCDNFPVEFSVEFIKKHLLSLPSAEPNTKCIAQIKVDRDDIEDLVNEKVKEIVDKMTEPRTGEWIQDGHHIRCDQCEVYFCKTDREGDTLPQNYCPNCGADMRGEEE